MRTYATMHPTKDAKQPSDTCNTILLAAGVGQAMDWPAGTSIARLTGQSTAGAAYNFYANLQSTYAVLPSSGSSVSTGVGVSTPIAGQDTFQIPGSSTGFSVIAQGAGYVHVECWKK